MSTRYLKWLFWRTLCRVIPSLRPILHFYPEGKYIQSFQISPFYSYHSKQRLSDLNQALSEDEKDFISQCWDKDAEIIPNEIERQERLTLFPSSTVNGLTGSIIHDNNVILDSADQTTLINHNKCKPAFFPKKKIAAPNVLYLSMVGLSLGHKHFYHFFIDLFPAVFCLLNALPNKNKLQDLGFDRIIILVREDLSPFQKHAYEYLTKYYSYIEVEFLKSNEILVNANIACYDFTQNIYSSYLPQNYVTFLKKIYAPQLLEHHKDQDTAVCGRYYISRGDTKNRNIQNEEIIMDFLKQLGFKRIYPAQLPLEKQIEIFSSAEVIISAAGAAFTNLIFANPLTKVGIFYPKGLVGSQYLWLSKSINMQTIIHDIVGDAENRRNHSEISLSAIKEMTLKLELRD